MAALSTTNTGQRQSCWNLLNMLSGLTVLARRSANHFPSHNLCFRRVIALNDKPKHFITAKPFMYPITFKSNDWEKHLSSLCCWAKPQSDKCVIQNLLIKRHRHTSVFNINTYNCKVKDTRGDILETSGSFTVMCQSNTGLGVSAKKPVVGGLHTSSLATCRTSQGIQSQHTYSCSLY